MHRPAAVHTRHLPVLRRPAALRWVPARRRLPAALAIAVVAITGATVGSTGTSAAAERPQLPRVSPTLVRVGSTGGVQQTGQHAIPYRPPGGAAQLQQQKAEAAASAATGGIQTGPSANGGGQNPPPTPPPAPPPSSAPPIGFDGIAAADSFCGCLPPDGAVAASTSAVVGAVNTAYAVWDPSGAPLQAPTALSALLSAPGCLPNFSDPFAAFDAAAGGHFVLGALTYDSTYSSSICVATSVTADPRGAWYVYAFAGPPADLLDFPRLAVGADALFVSVNQFQDGATFIAPRVYAYEKTAMYAGQPARVNYVDAPTNAAGKSADTLQPAGIPGGGAYLVSADNCNACSVVTVWTWTAPFAGSVFVLQGGVSVTSYSQPPNAAQPGGTVTTGDTRMLGAMAYGGTLYAAHAIGCNPGTGVVACVQWLQIGNPGGSPTLLQQGIRGGAGSRSYPSLAVDASGDLLLHYAYSSASAYPGVRYAAHVASDAAGTLGTETVVKAGEAFVDGSRWGDYAGVAVDPNGCTVWQLEEYAKSGDLWGTWISPVRLAACGGTPPPPPPPPAADYALSATPASQTVTAGASTSYTATVTGSGGFTGTVSFSVSGLPSGASGTFTPGSVALSSTTPTGSSTLSVATAGTTPAGSYPLTITATGGGKSHTAAVTLVVSAAPPPPPPPSPPPCVDGNCQN